MLTPLVSALRSATAVATATLVAGFGSIASVAAVPVQASASALGWVREVTPSPLDAYLEGVSCATAESCVAVGAQSLGSRTGALVESWDRRKWDLVAIPQPAGQTSAALMSVSCVSPASCLAVGSTGGPGLPNAHPFSEVLHGTRWEVVATATLPTGAGAQFSSVSCWAAGSCLAVGRYTTTSRQGTTLAEVYNGSAWSLNKMPTVAAGNVSLASVSCLPATVPALCTAVGSKATGGVTAPLVERANGTGWQVLHVPTASSSPDTALYAVSCPQPTSCMAVGTTVGAAGARGFSELDDLNHWTIVGAPAPRAARSSELLGVWCPLTVDLCEAVGTVGTANTATLAEIWEDSHWAVQSSGGPGLSVLNSVSCSPPTPQQPAPCTSVGSYQPNPDIGSHTLALRATA